MIHNDTDALLKTPILHRIVFTWSRMEAQDQRESGIEILAAWSGMSGARLVGKVAIPLLVYESCYIDIRGRGVVTVESKDSESRRT
jgi:hypothetical protein